MKNLKSILKLGVVSAIFLGGLTVVLNKTSNKIDNFLNVVNKNDITTPLPGDEHPPRARSITTPLPGDEHPKNFIS